MTAALAEHVEEAGGDVAPSEATFSHQGVPARSRERQMNAPAYSTLEESIAAIRGAVLKADAKGRPLCGCGAVLDGQGFYCSSCSRGADTQHRHRELQERHAAWRDEVARYAPLAGVPEWPWARVTNKPFTADVQCQRFLKFAQVYQPEHGSVLLSAKTDAAKTACTVACLHRLRDAEVAKVLASKPGTKPSKALWTLRGLLWTDGYELAKARKGTPLGQGEARVVERAMSCRLLVLDEVGFEFKADTVIEEIANARYVAGLPTVLTTGLTTKLFRERYGDACYRRLTQRGNVLEVDQ